MKKAYNAPQLTIHGSVENITNAFGNPAINDTFHYGSTAFAANGSVDGVVVPKP
ncbi:lasso peptide [Anabaena sp. 4-3]|uniref:lasso peptide n=1 Tax=Anabaena sp. 4-3 TaxID=1811979 RepID=UPI000AA90AB7|nr:lasso peptide [Anabaena sp. 4-3]